MKISVVTISFNQSQFISETIKSVISQRKSGIDVEYIIVDPGSTDGSREIIDSFGAEIDKKIFQPDSGPADGLNRGFASASGDLLCYLNSDDTFEADAFEKVLSWFENNEDHDVVCGHGWAIDGSGARLRRVWSESYTRLSVAYGSSVQIQPSTFIRAKAFQKAGGFNEQNRCSWDGELLMDIFLSGAKIGLINAYLSNYRLHETSITNSGRLEMDQREWAKRRFRRLMSRDFQYTDQYAALFWRAYKHISHPLPTLERIFHGPMFKRGAS